MELYLGRQHLHLSGTLTQLNAALTNAMQSLATGTYISKLSSGQQCFTQTLVKMQ